MSNLVALRSKLNEIDQEISELQEYMTQTYGQELASAYKTLKEKRARLYNEYNTEVTNGKN